MIKIYHAFVTMMWRVFLEARTAFPMLLCVLHTICTKRMSIGLNVSVRLYACFNSRTTIRILMKCNVVVVLLSAHPNLLTFNSPQSVMTTWRTYEILGGGEEIAETKVTTRETVLRSSPGEEVLCSSETKHNKKTAPRPKLCRREDYRNKGHNPETLSWVRVPMKIFYTARELSIIEKRRFDQSRLFRRDYRT
jgi:hypothetical protein